MLRSIIIALALAASLATSGCAGTVGAVIGSSIRNAHDAREREEKAKPPAPAKEAPASEEQTLRFCFLC